MYTYDFLFLDSTKFIFIVYYIYVFKNKIKNQSFISVLSLFYPRNNIGFQPKLYQHNLFFIYHTYIIELLIQGGITYKKIFVITLL